MLYNVLWKSIRRTRAFLVTQSAKHVFRTVLNEQKPNNYYFHDTDLQLVKLKENRRKWNSSFVKLMMPEMCGLMCCGCPERDSSPTRTTEHS